MGLASQTGMASTVCVVGSLNMDLVVRTSRIPRPGELVFGGTFHTYLGGRGANQAAAAARLGARVSMIGCIGDDAYGPLLLQALSREGVDVSCVMTRSSTPSGVSVLTVDPSGVGTMVVAPGANEALAAADVAFFEESIRASDVVLLQLEVPLEVVAFVAKHTVSFRKRLLLTAAPPRALPRDVLRSVDVVIANRGAAALLGGSKVSDPPEVQVRSLARLGPEISVVTLGPEGAVLFDGREIHRQPTFPVATIDPLAAGDAFVGAFAAVFAEGMPLPQALRWACAAGSLATTKEGALLALPSRAAVLELVGSTPVS
jgi:ribokinase